MRMPNVPNWSVHLTGAGKLLPNGLTQTLPPLSAWSPQAIGSTQNSPDAYIDTPQEYEIDSFGACNASAGSSSDPDKALGNPKDVPGCPICGDLPSGDPISVGTGNMFEQVADYQTSGPNPLSFTRYYNSMSASNTFATTLGTNWRSNYDRYLRIVSASRLRTPASEREEREGVAADIANKAH
jgi:hypothetical protein